MTSLFEGGIGVLKCGGPLNSTGVRLLYHQTSEISINLFWTKISLWLFQVSGFEGQIGVFLCREDPFFQMGRGFEITKHLKIAYRHLFYYSNVFDVGFFV
jgi:hypothetical protein